MIYRVSYIFLNLFLLIACDYFLRASFFRKLNIHLFDVEFEWHLMKDINIKKK